MRDGACTPTVGYEGGDDKLCLKLATQVMIPGEGFHLAFTATEPNQVHEFHAAALRHGGRCNGEPGLRRAVQAMPGSVGNHNAGDA